MESDNSGSLSNILISLLSYTASGGQKLSHLIEGMQLSVGTSLFAPSILAEFISVIGDLISQTDFVSSLRKAMPNLSWQLRYKLLGVYVDTLPLSEKVNILSNAVSLLQEAQFVHLFEALTQCYASFDELKNQAPKTDEKVLEDTEATSKMESEALDAGFRDTEGEIVRKGESLSQELRNYLSVLDVITRIFTPSNETLP